jgi:hypothetical protein
VSALPPLKSRQISLKCSRQENTLKDSLNTHKEKMVERFRRSFFARFGLRKAIVVVLAIDQKR